MFSSGRVATSVFIAAVMGLSLEVPCPAQQAWNGQPSPPGQPAWQAGWRPNQDPALHPLPEPAPARAGATQDPPLHPDEPRQAGGQPNADGAKKNGQADSVKKDTQAEPKPAAPATTYPTVKINGFFQADAGYFGQDSRNRAMVGDIQDGAGFRRFRLSASGAVADNVNYFSQLDFGFFGRPTFTDVWGEITDVPTFGNIRVGQWKQPFSLEVATSVRYQTFLERSVLFQSLTPFRHIGAGFYDHSGDEMTTWAASVFRTGNDQFGDDIGDNGGWSTAARATHLLWWDEVDCGTHKERDFLHVGGAFWLGDPGNNLARYRSIPEAYIGEFGVPAGTLPGTSGVQVPTIANGTPAFVDTGALAVHSFQHFGTELVWARGPLTWQSECQFAHVARAGAANPFFWGYYTQVSWFLTGESRAYNRKLGQLDRIVPIRPYTTKGCDCGPGAWEIAARVSHLDLDSQDIFGGRIVDLTLGLNWYLNGNTKFQINSIHSFLDRATPALDGRSEADIIAARFQLDF